MCIKFAVLTLRHLAPLGKQMLRGRWLHPFVHNYKGKTQKNCNNMTTNRWRIFNLRRNETGNGGQYV